MTCQSCFHRLDVTLWGGWLATGCRLGLVIRCQCDKHKAGCQPESAASQRQPERQKHEHQDATFPAGS